MFFCHLQQRSFAGDFIPIAYAQIMPTQPKLPNRRHTGRTLAWEELRAALAAQALVQ